MCEVFGRDARCEGDRATKPQEVLRPPGENKQKTNDFSESLHLTG